MIHWTLQSAATLASQPGELPGGLLSPAERARWETFKLEKRRRDWLLGRWAAKLALLQVLAEDTGVTFAMDALSVENDPRGVPYASLRLSADARRLPLSLSISHSGDSAACALLAAEMGTVGIDLEGVQPRSAAFIRDYFTPEEAARVERARSQAELAITTNAIWSAKEAALKALGLGLTVDTRSVSCLIEPRSRPPRDWESFLISFDSSLLGNLGEYPERNARASVVFPTLRGWWQSLGDFVITLVVCTQGSRPRQPIRIQRTPQFDPATLASLGAPLVDALRDGNS